MLHTDRLTLAILLCRIHLKGQGDPLDQEFQYFLRGREGVVPSEGGGPSFEGLTSEQTEAMLRLASRVAPFSDLLNQVKGMHTEFVAWLQQSAPENCVPALWKEDKPLPETSRSMYRLLLIQVS